MQLLRNIGFEAPDWQDLVYLLLGAIVLVSLSGAAWTLWQRARHDPWLRLLARATGHLQRAGVVIAPNSAPRAIARQLASQRDPQHPATRAMIEWLLRLEAQRYAPAGAHATPLATLQREFKQLAYSK